MGAILKPSIYTKEIHNKDNYDTTSASSSIKAGGNITADTGSTTIIGSNLAASGDVVIKTDIGGINILTSQELGSTSVLNKKMEVRLANLKEILQGEKERTKESLNPDGSSNTKVKVKVASATFDESEVHAQAVHNVSSTIVSHGGNVKLDSSEDITIAGSTLAAHDTIDLKSTTGNITIQEATDSQSTQSKEKHASAQVSGTVQNEYVEIGSAIQAAVESAEQLKKVKEDYSNYKRSVKELESTLSTIKQQYRDKVPGVDFADIDDMSEIISNTKDDQKYYVAAIAAATADLASKTVAIAAQAATAAASSEI
jgi:filamentous hemagglutinin